MSARRLEQALAAFERSGGAQQLAVAEFIRGVAGNGGHQAKPGFLVGCAQALGDAAASLADQADYGPAKARTVALRTIARLAAENKLTAEDLLAALMPRTTVHYEAVMWAQEHLTDDECEVNPEATATSEGADGVWVCAWLHVPADKLNQPTHG